MSVQGFALLLSSDRIHLVPRWNWTEMGEVVVRGWMHGCKALHRYGILELAGPEYSDRADRYWSTEEVWGYDFLQSSI